MPLPRPVMRLIRPRRAPDPGVVLLRSVCHELRPPMATLTALVQALERDQPEERRGELARLAAEHAVHAQAVLGQAAAAANGLAPARAAAVPLSAVLPGIAATTLTGATTAFSPGATATTSPDATATTWSGATATTSPDATATSWSGAAAASGPDRLTVTMTRRAAAWPVQPQHTRQILLNLVGNAMCHSPGPVRLVARRWGSRLRLSVFDTGVPSPGLTAALRRRTPPPTDRGLGLWVVRGLVAAAGGSIRARASSSGKCVEVSLPRHHG
ncbi:sensor histidine kinase [Paractinoplanes abujensis]|uniref:histidine kinase n=1 Tax=Paractinoplanes abujensis TaxID=882441 RepID=A0A7W7G2G0_9ACTN|nr:ATP-binding protein [Actinoplanes abujensis]MBB4693742.1 signal transduction histidine kinase [Actinoplanes abujensis]